MSFSTDLSQRTGQPASQSQVLSKFYDDAAAKELEEKKGQFTLITRVFRRSVLDPGDNQCKILPLLGVKRTGKFLHLRFKANPDTFLFNGDFKCNSRLKLSIRIHGEQRDVIKDLKWIFTVSETRGNKVFSLAHLEGVQLKTSIISLRQYEMLRKEFGCDNTTPRAARTLNINDDDARVFFESHQQDHLLRTETVSANLLCNIQELKEVQWTLPISKVYETFIANQQKSPEEVLEEDHVAEVSAYLDRLRTLEGTSEEELLRRAQETIQGRQEKPK
ncbi:MAG: hypothetical protein CK425_08575 [Parachlamydia sp.]|nr:MAG: hypothetical protein CK425_08575 [Parachlamydia sp.]